MPHSVVGMADKGYAFLGWCFCLFNWFGLFCLFGVFVLFCLPRGRGGIKILNEIEYRPGLHSLGCTGYVYYLCAYFMFILAIFLWNSGSSGNVEMSRTGIHRTKARVANGMRWKLEVKLGKGTDTRLLEWLDRSELKTFYCFLLCPSLSLPAPCEYRN